MAYAGLILNSMHPPLTKLATKWNYCWSP